ncbi:efflux RND transporter permease subunit [Tissierella praeacuta]|uniref:efflux RND transporter permease subunit n=1 Tax=Tissierella praeacuta TaxID=43131 RepID=UPI001C107C9D|nr:efflux RND transporter permease subunit [Tissierella praeacuta]MBU5255527.1 efflux RND transporter permease subunit [Tissierella praeacuta]
MSIKNFIAMEGIKNSTMDIDEFQNLGIHLKYKTESVSSIEDLMNIKIRTPQGVTVPLREIGQIEINKKGNMVTRQNYKYTIEILSYTDGRAFSHIVSDVQRQINEFPLPKDYSISMTGDQEELSKSMKDMIFSLILSVIFVYLVLVPQFKSFIHPITIMSAIPLVIIGVAPALGLSGKYISMPVLLGFILLAGTVVNNAILLVEHTNNLRKEGMALEESLVEAVKARYRPIMMTALSDITGMLPLALELALGAERFSPLAIAVIGGMLASTLLTMIIIPVIYASFEKLISIFTKNKKEEGI